MAKKKLTHSPLQTKEWAAVYDGTIQRHLVNSQPVFVRVGYNKYTRHYFTSIQKPALRVVDQGVLEELLTSLREQNGRISHIMFEPPPYGQEIDYQVNGLKQYPLRTSTPMSTVIYDLSLSAEELLQQSKKSHRQDIRKSYKKDVSIEIFTSGHEAIDRFAKIYNNKQTSSKFAGLGEKHHRKIWQNMSPAGMCYIIIMVFEGQDVGAYMVCHNDETAFQVHGARTATGRKNRLAPRLSYETMLAAKDLGLNYYDMWGVGIVNQDGTLDMNNSESGVGKYKADFGGKLVRLQDARVYIANKPAYLVYIMMRRMLTKFRAMRG
ncbi:MAG: GNAT family N-acetyltransferase [Patescibacteria group bacterium]